MRIETLEVPTDHKPCLELVDLPIRLSLALEGPRGLDDLLSVRYIAAVDLDHCLLVS